MGRGTGSTRSRRGKLLALGVLPAAVTTAALAAGLSPAGANTTTTTHSFVDGSGITRSCTVNMTRTHPFGGDAQVGEGGTSTSGSSFCTDPGTISYIGATWNDPDGQSQSVLHQADGQTTVRRFAPIGSDFITVHEVDFTGNPLGCQTNCIFTSTRSK